MEMLRLSRLALFLVGTALLSGCLAARVPRMIEAHDAAERLPAKGDWQTAQARRIVSGGLQREYWIQKPSGARKQLPIVLLLHGGTQTAEEVWRQTSLPTLAQREGFILAAPQGIAKHWNDGRGSTIAGDKASTANDVQFLRDVVQSLVLNDGGDPRARPDPRARDLGDHRGDRRAVSRGGWRPGRPRHRPARRARSSDRAAHRRRAAGAA